MSGLTIDVLLALSEEKANAAWALLEKGCHSDAYYLVGYAVELALKAIVARDFAAGTIPDKKMVNDLYTHDLKSLIKLAGISAVLDQRRRDDVDFDAAWELIFTWKEDARYRFSSPEEAYALVNSVMGKSEVLKWLRSFT